MSSVFKEGHHSVTNYISDGNDWAYITISKDLGLIQAHSSFGAYGFCFPNQKGDGFLKFLFENGDDDADYIYRKFLIGKKETKSDEAFYEKLLEPFFREMQAILFEKERQA